MADEKAIAFTEKIRTTFPESASRADQLMAERGFEEDEIVEMISVWLSAFADVTGEKMMDNASDMVKAHFTFFSSAYEMGSAEVRKLIDVDYVENLFWHIPAEVSAGYWPSMPNKLQDLYVDFHGTPPF